jgi:hypothetical protein
MAYHVLIWMWNNHAIRFRNSLYLSDLIHTLGGHHTWQTSSGGHHGDLCMMNGDRDRPSSASNTLGRRALVLVALSSARFVQVAGCTRLLGAEAVGQFGGWGRG